MYRPHNCDGVVWGFGFQLASSGNVMNTTELEQEGLADAQVTLHGVVPRKAAHMLPMLQNELGHLGGCDCAC